MSRGTVRFVRAPGRVNLIGDHTDYQGGLCLPIAIERDVVIGFRPRADGLVRLQSLDLDAAVELRAGGGSPDAIAPWARPIAETLALLAPRSATPFPGFDAAVTSTVPIGAGLSSSAAFEVALAVVTAAVAGLHLDPIELALAAQEVEQRASGVPCGVMDQIASTCGRADHALLLDCRTLEIEPVPLPHTAGVLVIHSGLERQLATSAYADATRGMRSRGRACSASRRCATRRSTRWPTIRLRDTS